MSRGLLARLELLEVDSSVARDCRRVLQGERFAILAAMRSGDAARIAGAEREARRGHEDVGRVTGREVHRAQHSVMPTSC